MSRSAPDLHPVDAIVLSALREKTRELLALCTEPQRAFFEKVFPAAIDHLPEAKLRDAIGICQRTIKKNERDAHDGMSGEPIATPSPPADTDHCKGGVPPRRKAYGD